MVKAGANLEQADPDGDTPLLQAATIGQADVARSLIDAGANIDAIDNDGDTPLMCAIQGDGNVYTSGHLAIASVLVEAGCNLDHRNINGATALDIARKEAGNKKVLIDLLIATPVNRARKHAAEADLLDVDLRVVRQGIEAAQEHGSLSPGDIARLLALAKRAAGVQRKTSEALRQLVDLPPLAFDRIAFAACARICKIDLDEASFTQEELSQVAAKVLAVIARKGLAEGQLVRVRNVPNAEAKRLAIGHGGWNPKMASHLGKEGSVVKTDSDGDVVVITQSGSFCWNPLMVEALEHTEFEQLEFEDPELAKGFALRCQTAFEEASRQQRAAKQGTSCTFYFVDAELIRGSTMQRFLSLQELRVHHPEAVEAVEMSIEDACTGNFAADMMACSHRWVSRSSNHAPCVPNSSGLHPTF